MAYNYTGYKDLGATILPQLYTSATGGDGGSLTNWTTDEWTNVANKLIHTGTDNVLGAISQVMGDTLFAVDSYTAPLMLLQTSASEFANLERIIKFYDMDTEKSDAYDFTNVVYNGNTNLPNPWALNMAEPVQFNVQGKTTFQRHQSFDFEGFKNSLRSAEELARFWGASATVGKNTVEIDREALRRGTLLNYIGGVIVGAGQGIGTERVVNLLKEYNDEVNPTTPLTMATYRKPENFADFSKFCIARIREYSIALTHHDILYQTNVPNASGKNFTQHLPKERQRLLLYAPLVEQLNTRVKADTFHRDALTIADYELVSHWQNPVMGHKDEINVTCSYLDGTGTVVDGNTLNIGYGVDADNTVVLGVLYDKNAVSCATIQQTARPSTILPNTGHFTVWYNWVDRWMNDFTAKGIVFVLSDAQ